MAIKKTKISDLPPAKSLSGLSTLGVDANNKSVKVELEFLQTTAEALLAALPVEEQIPGTTASLDVVGRHIYRCGEMTDLRLATVAPTEAEAVIRFRSGAQPTTLSWPQDVMGLYAPAANQSYEISIASRQAVMAELMD